MNLFSPALLCSKVVLYNRTGGLLTEEILNQLGMMTQAGKRLRAGQTVTDSDDAPTDRDSAMGGDGSTNEGSAKSKPCFGHLIILFNRCPIDDGELLVDHSSYSLLR